MPTCVLKSLRELGPSSHQLQVSLCGWVHACVFPWQNRLFRLANWITLLRAKSLAAEIKQLCFVVMVHKILFKIRLPSRNGRKLKKKKKRGEVGKGETELPQNLFEQNVTRSFSNGAKTQLFNWRRKRRTSAAREGSWGKWRIWGNKKRGEKSNWWKGPRGRSGGLKKTREKILITFQSSQTRSALIGALISCERENGYIDFSSHHSPPAPPECITRNERMQVSMLNIISIFNY